MFGLRRRRSKGARERFIKCGAPLPARFHPDVYTSLLFTCQREKGHSGGHKAVTTAGRVYSWGSRDRIEDRA